MNTVHLTGGHANVPKRELWIRGRGARFVVVVASAIGYSFFTTVNVPGLPPITTIKWDP